MADAIGIVLVIILAVVLSAFDDYIKGR